MPDSLRIHGDRAKITTPLEWFSCEAFQITGFSSVGSVQNVICPPVPSSRRTSPIVFTSPWIFSAHAGTGLRRRSSIRPKIFRNSSLGAATPANWNVTYRPWRTTLVPILTSYSRSVVIDQRAASSGCANFRLRLQADIQSPKIALCFTPRCGRS